MKSEISMIELTSTADPGWMLKIQLSESKNLSKLLSIIEHNWNHEDKPLVRCELDTLTILADHERLLNIIHTLYLLIGEKGVKINEPLIERLFHWHMINCNGDWEHAYGVRISGEIDREWQIRIDLTDTALCEAEYSIKPDPVYCIPVNCELKIEDSTFLASCNLFSLQEVIRFFFGEIYDKQLDRSLFYEVYLPIKGELFDIWVLAKGEIVTDKLFELVQVPSSCMDNEAEIKVLEFSHYRSPYYVTLCKSPIEFSVGNRVEVSLKELYDGVNLTACLYK